MIVWVDLALLVIGDEILWAGQDYLSGKKWHRVQDGCEVQVVLADDMEAIGGAVNALRVQHDCSPAARRA
jgi:hypothetical protein